MIKMAKLKLQGLQVCENEVCVSEDAREIYSYAIYIYIINTRCH